MAALEEKLRTEQEHEALRGAIELFLVDCRQACPGRLIRILCGEANPRLYGDPDVQALLQHLHKDKDVTIRINMGPVAVADESGKNGLVELARADVVELRCRPGREGLIHHRLIESCDDLLLRAERPHESLEPFSTREVIDLERLSQIEREYWPQKYLHDFDARWEQLSAEEPRRQPLLVSWETFLGLRRQLEERNRIYDFVRQEELIGLLDGAANHR